MSASRPVFKSPPGPAAAVPQPSRMKLAAIRQSKQEAPLRWLLYGVEGIGKSTFGAEAPSPIFISAESGLKRLDVPMFPQPTTFKEVLDAIDELTMTDHPYKTLVIDTLDWIEPLIWKEVCRASGAQSIEDVGGGFQKGYIAAVDVWRVLLARIERLHEEKQMEVGFLAHAAITTFNNPNGPDYKRYRAAFQEKSYEVVKQWVEIVLFGNFEDVYGPDPGKKKGQVKGVSTGKRELFTERTAAYDAKNRLGLAPVLPFSYADFAAATKAGHAGDPSDLLAECERLIDAIKPTEADTIRTYLTEHAADAGALAKSLNTLRVMATEAGVS